VTARASHQQDTTTTRELPGGDEADQDLRTYVLDTSVLLSDPRAFFRFAEHNVVIPVVVISELEGKRHDPEIGYFARQALRHLDELRIEHGRLDFPVPVGEDGTLRVELNNTDQGVLPSGLRLSDNDSRILAVAMNLAQDGQEVTVVSKDLPMRVKAASLGIQAEEYLAEQAVDSGWTGIATLDLSGDEISDLYETELANHPDVAGLAPNTGLIIHSERGSALGRVTRGSEFKLVRGDREVFGLHGRSAEQRIAIDLLMDPEVGIVSLGAQRERGLSCARASAE
jgi:PhoH-like ATPase